MDTAFQHIPSEAGEAATSLRLFDIKALGKLIYAKDGRGDAAIVVVVPLYNYRAMIIECLESLVSQDLQPLSVMVIDDGSTDDGGAVASAFLARHEARFANVLVVRHLRNQGLSMARNSGVAWSREPYVFMLDADNRIKRPCLSRLLEALEVSGAAFAYPQLRMFGDVEGIGAADLWDPPRLRIGNYIDAMALIRRDKLIAAGGYATLANEYGWEDYDLWCRFAQLGYEGVFLPEILGEYRVHGSSMLRAQTNKYTKLLAAELALRHPELFAARLEGAGDTR